MKFQRFVNDTGVSAPFIQPRMIGAGAALAGDDGQEAEGRGKCAANHIDDRNSFLSDIDDGCVEGRRGHMMRCLACGQFQKRTYVCSYWLE